MKRIIMILFLSAQVAFAAQAQDRGIGRGAAECGFFYLSSQKWAPIATDKQRAAAKSLQNLMFVIAKRHGISSSEFTNIIEVYKPKLDQHISEHDRNFIQGEANRCFALAMREAKMMQDNRHAGG